MPGSAKRAEEYIIVSSSISSKNSLETS